MVAPEVVAVSGGIGRVCNDKYKDGGRNTCI